MESWASAVMAVVDVDASPQRFRLWCGVYDGVWCTETVTGPPGRQGVSREETDFHVIFAKVANRPIPQQAQHICITFVQCLTNIKNVGPTFYKCYTTVLCLLGNLVNWPTRRSSRVEMKLGQHRKRWAEFWKLKWAATANVLIYSICPPPPPPHAAPPSIPATDDPHLSEKHTCTPTPRILS